METYQHRSSKASKRVKKGGSVAGTSSKQGPAGSSVECKAEGASSRQDQGYMSGFDQNAFMQIKDIHSMHQQEVSGPSTPQQLV